MELQNLKITYNVILKDSKGNIKLIVNNISPNLISRDIDGNI